MRYAPHIVRSVTAPSLADPLGGEPPGREPHEREPSERLPFERWQGSTRNKLARVAWNIVWALLFRPSPRPLHAWRAFLLRRFGATLGPRCHIYPGARIWAPWNLVCEEGAAIADEAVIYNPARVTMGAYSIVSQQAYVCTATHDFNDPTFPMVVAPISLGRRAWVCARACVLPGVALGDGAVLGLAGVATKDIEPWQIHAGNPARLLKRRTPVA